MLEIQRLEILGLKCIQKNNEFMLNPQMCASNEIFV